MDSFKTFEDAGKVAKIKFGSGWIAPDSDYGIYWFKNKPMKSAGGDIYSVDPRFLNDKPAWKYVGGLDASKYPKPDLIKI